MTELEREDEIEEPSRLAGPMSMQDRRLLATRLTIACSLLVVPLLIMVAVIVYALHRGEQTSPWSHRSVASATTRAAPNV
jgi:hypothetical protein